MKFRTAGWALTAALLLVPTVVTTGAGSAIALGGVGDQTRVIHETSQRCLTALGGANQRRDGGVALLSPSVCDVKIVETLSPARKLSAHEADLARRDAGIAADTNPVYSKGYQYTVVQVTDQEVMKGTYYYDGFHVWQSTSYRGHVGSKSCWVSYSVTYSIDIKACTGGGLSTSSISAHMRLLVTLAKITPISWREDYYVTMKPIGSSSIRKG